MSTRNIPTDKVFYMWTNLKNGQDYIRLHDIRLMVSYNTGNNPKFVSAVPVLVHDGKHPDIKMCCSSVYRIKTKSGGFKYFYGKPTEEEAERAVEVPMLYSGDPSDSSIFNAIAEDLCGYTGDIDPFNEPMWCRYAATRKNLYPIDNMVVRDELGIDRDIEIDKVKLKERWDNMAEPAGCCGFASSGMFWEYGMIRFGGVVCVPTNQFVPHKNVIHSILLSDFKHIQKTRKWNIL